MPSDLKTFPNFNPTTNYPTMTSFRFLLTYNDGSIVDRYTTAETLVEALAAIAIQSANAKQDIIGITALLMGDDPEVSPVKPPKLSKKRPSRADRFSNAIGAIEDAKGEVEGLRDELQSWRDNLPENLQNGSKADELDNAISELEDTISDIENVTGHDVEFPGMF